MKKLMVVMMSIFSVSCSLIGIGSEEQPKYEVIEKFENKEIRKYQPYIVAKVTVAGTFKEAQNKGFRILAGYIFGDNETKQKIAMTSPVVQRSEKISMTSPVILQPDTSKNEEQWTMLFSMPSSYTLENLPEANNKKIIFEKVSEQLVAAYRFTGFWNEAKNSKKAAELGQWISSLNKFDIISAPKFAGYNPPWTLPFLRRNEMHIEVKPR